MSVVQNLYELQERDNALERGEQRLAQIRAELADDRALAAARCEWDAELAVRDDLQKQQRDLENEIADLTSKIDKAQEELYSGRIRNPKELSNLEQEVSLLKTTRSGKEDEVIGLLESLEAAAERIASLDEKLAGLEAAWRTRQVELTSEQTALTTEVTGLREQRAELLAQIDPGVVSAYTGLRSQKGMAVARVDQGICQGCRLALSNSELQRARGDGLTQCTSCGRILFVK